MVNAIPSDVNLEDEDEGIEESIEFGEAGAPVSPWRLRGDTFHLFCSVFVWFLCM